MQAQDNTGSHNNSPGTSQDIPSATPARPKIDDDLPAGWPGPGQVGRPKRVLVDVAAPKLSGRTLPRPGNSLSDSAYVLTRAYRRLGGDGAIRRRRTVGKFRMRFQYGAGSAMGRRRRSTRRRCLSDFKGLAADAMKFRRLYFFEASRFLKRRRWVRLR